MELYIYPRKKNITYSVETVDFRICTNLIFIAEYLKGCIVITSENFIEEFTNTASDAFVAMAGQVEEALETELCTLPMSVDVAIGEIT